jgi:hypothetical protein
MNHSMRAIAHDAAAVLVCLVAIRSKAFAQNTTPGPTRVPVCVAISKQDLGSDNYRIVRRSGAVEPHDILLLKPRATSDDLSDALNDLLAIRRAAGDTAQRSALLRLRRPRTEALHGRRFPWATRVLADVRTASEKPIEGFGDMQAVTIWLPPQGHGRPPPDSAP